MRRKRPSPINQTIIPPSELSQKIPGETKIETRKTNYVNSTAPMHSINNLDEGITHTRHLIPDVPFHPGPTYRPPSKLIRPHMPRSHEHSQSLDSQEPQILTLSMPHVTIVMISCLVKKVPSQELLCATELSVRLI